MGNYGKMKIERGICLLKYFVLNYFLGLLAHLRRPSACFPSYSLAIAYFEFLVNTKGQYYYCPFIFTEREGFEPSIPVSQYTRLAGERLRPYSAISPLLEITIYLNYFIMSNKKYIFLKKAVKYALFVFLYRSAVQTLLLCRT